MALAGNLIFALFLLVGLLATVLGLPGTIVIAMDAFVYGALTGFERMPWWLVVILFACAAVAETVDNVLSAWTVRRYEGSARGMFGAVVGGIVGALCGGALGGGLGAVFGPVIWAVMFVVGPLAGALALSFAGSLLAEKSTGAGWPEALRAASGAFVGRVLGVLVKVVLAAIMVVLAAVAVYG